MTRIVILANSKRPDGQCLGGVDLENGMWIRPVTRTGDGIPTQRCFVNGKFIEIRDILDVDLFRPRQITEFQRENHIIRNWDWKISGRFKLNAINRFIDNNAPILHSGNDRVSPKVLKKLTPEEWRSLQLVKPRKLKFCRHYFDPHRWVAEFEDQKGNRYSLKVTDPIATRRLENDETISKECVLTVSMTKPWTPNAAEKEAHCYKVVAAVIELA